MKKLLLFIYVLWTVTSFAQDQCDSFGYKTKDQYALEFPMHIYDGKINYSRVFVDVPFLDDFKPGLYILGSYRNMGVDVYAYMPKDSDYVQIYMEPSINRSPAINRFYPCIDRHIKANVDFFTKTCLKKKKISKDTYTKLSSVLDGEFVGLEHYCWRNQKYSAMLYEKKEGGSVRIAEIEDMSVLAPEFDREPIFRKFHSVDSLVVGIFADEVLKCSWYNLVSDPQSFAAEIYHANGYELILTEEDCPAL